MAVPKLRFKEFDNDWINTKVKDLGEFSSGGTPSKDIHDYWNGNIPWISSSDLNEESISDIRINRFISEDAIKNSATKKIPKNSILLVSRVGVGKVALTNQELCTSQDFTALTPKKDYALFIAYLMKNITPRLLDLNQGTSIKGFVREDLISLPISLPSKAEQTKIASFLSAVDEKISQLTQKHALLSQYKQGMMQKLFSQQIRFKADDGSEFGEWASEKISKVFTNKSKSFNPLLNESLPCIELEHLSQNTGQILGTVNSSDQQSTKNLFEPNSVLYGKLRPYLRKFAKPQFKGVCSSEIWVLTGLKISNDYLFQFVQSEQFTELTNIQSGSKMPRADWNVIADSEIEFPCLEEQTKIANFLSAIDQKVEVVAQQIKQAKTWKKGLLQQMFI